MYDNVAIRWTTIRHENESFLITIALLQSLTSSPCLFALVMDEFTRHIHGEVPWCMLFVDNIVLVKEIREEIIFKVDRWREALESKGFKISRMKMKYMVYNFRRTLK